MSDLLLGRIKGAVGDRYSIDTEIGRGGMSAVYRAYDVRLARPVAIKVLPPDLAFNPGVRERFMREAQTAARLSHPNIVPIHSVDEHDGVAFFVMAYVSGGNLATLLHQTPAPPLAGVRRLLREVADALAYAHGHGVVHRDIKPDNILLDPDSGSAMVTDFGIARAMEEGQGNRLTLTGVAVGTPAYMSPEQAVGERNIDGRTDIYSLGIVGYQMLAGAVPFRASNTPAMLMKQVSERPAPLRSVRPDLPRALCDAIDRSLAKAPSQRWQNAAAFRDAIARGDAPHPSGQGGPRHIAKRPAQDPSLREARRMQQHGARAERRRLRAAAASAADRARPLRERISRFRRFAAATAFAAVAGFMVVVGGAAAEFPPALLAGIPPVVMASRLRRRARSLRRDGISARNALFHPDIAFEAMIIEGEWLSPDELVAGLAPRDVLDGPHGARIRSAAETRLIIARIVKGLPPTDRALLPDVSRTVDALVERIAALAATLHRLDASVTHDMLQRLDARAEELRGEDVTSDRDRRLALLERQRGTLAELLERRSTLWTQLDSAGLALENLRLDLLKLREAGVGSAIDDVTSATQEARALSREIGTVLDAASEVKGL
ncbi:MAG: protein kinase domain-containing protein [Gemmatimonadaceae bacterium]